jgi:hypothetical protein
MKRRVGRAVVLVGVAGVVLGCVRTGDGLAVPVADQVPSASATPSTTGPAEAREGVTPGVVPTARVPIRAEAVTCSQPVKPAASVTVEVADPQAPKIVIAVPGDWSTATGSGDLGARLDGPEGMWATATISATKLDPAAAFTQYVDQLMGESAVSTVSVLAAPLCGYSGQKLMGAWSDTPQNAVEFTDRIVHVWTNTNAYLIAVHAQAPTGRTGFGDAASLLTQDFEIGIP